LPPFSDAALLDRLGEAARQQHTPCGEGRMIWRSWGAGPPLLLFHGGYGSWTHWLRNIAGLAERYRVVAPDLPGLGDSAMPPSPYTPESVATILDAGLDTVLLERERFHLVGFSFGNMVGSWLAAARGAQIRSFTLVGAAGLALPRAPMRPLLPMRPHLDAAAMAELQRVNLGILMFADPARIDDLAIRLQVENVGRARLKSRRFAPTDVLRRALPLIAAPLAGIWGERDVTAYPHVAERGALLRATQPEAGFDVIAGAGHWVQYEAAEEFNTLLAARLTAQEKAAAGGA
jgi:pimeloyl-ACP methyl ester carboxylesterase